MTLKSNDGWMVVTGLALASMVLAACGDDSAGGSGGGTGSGGDSATSTGASGDPDCTQAAHFLDVSGNSAGDAY